MSRRTERVANLIRQTLGQALLSRLSDPRIDPARTSIVRVEVPEDLLTARVYVSVLGTAGQQTRALRALRHAAGHLQELLVERVSLRNTPVLRFELDVQFKKTLQTLDILERVAEEIRQKDEAARAAGGQGEEGPVPHDPTEAPQAQ